MADFRITIDLPESIAEDAETLAESIEADLASEFDVFTVRVSQKVGESFFSREPGDDIIEG